MSDNNTVGDDFSVPHPDELLIEAGLAVQATLAEALQRYRAIKMASIISVLAGRMTSDEADERLRAVSDLAYVSMSLIDSLLVAAPEESRGGITRNVRMVENPEGVEEEVVAPYSIVRTIEDLRRLPSGTVIRYPLGESWLIAERSRKDESDWFTFLGTVPSEEIGLPAILLAGPVRDDVERVFLGS